VTPDTNLSFGSNVIVFSHGVGRFWDVGGVAVLDDRVVGLEDYWTPGEGEESEERGWRRNYDCRISEGGK
jgi:hypothetical protein